MVDTFRRWMGMVDATDPPSGQVWVLGLLYAASTTAERRLEGDKRGGLYGADKSDYHGSSSPPSHHQWRPRPVALPSAQLQLALQGLPWITYRRGMASLQAAAKAGLAGEYFQAPAAGCTSGPSPGSSEGSGSPSRAIPDSSTVLSDGSSTWSAMRRTFGESAVGGRGVTTDAGWGCMLRTTQMLACQAVQVHWGKEGWRAGTAAAAGDKGRGGSPNSSHRHGGLPVSLKKRLAWLFADLPRADCTFSMHALCAAGALQGKKVGEWYGPRAAACVLRECFAKWEELQPAAEGGQGGGGLLLGDGAGSGGPYGPGLRVMVAGDGGVVCADYADDLCCRHSYVCRCDECHAESSSMSTTGRSGDPPISASRGAAAGAVGRHRTKGEVERQEQDEEGAPAAAYQSASRHVPDSSGGIVKSQSSQSASRRRGKLRPGAGQSAHGDMLPRASSPEIADTPSADLAGRMHRGSRQCARRRSADAGSAASPGPLLLAGWELLGHDGEQMSGQGGIQEASDALPSACDATSAPMAAPLLPEDAAAAATEARGSQGTSEGEGTSAVGPPAAERQLSGGWTVVETQDYYHDNTTERSLPGTDSTQRAPLPRSPDLPPLLPSVRRAGSNDSWDVVDVPPKDGHTGPAASPDWHLRPPAYGGPRSPGKPSTALPMGYRGGPTGASSAPSEERGDSREQGEDPEWRSSLLLIVPLRLGPGTQVERRFVAPLAELFRVPQCIGVVGGTPGHSLYLVGADHVDVDDWEESQGSRGSLGTRTSGRRSGSSGSGRSGSASHPSSSGARHTTTAPRLVPGAIAGEQGSMGTARASLQPVQHHAVHPAPLPGYHPFKYSRGLFLDPHTVQEVPQLPRGALEACDRAAARWTARRAASRASSGSGEAASRGYQPSSKDSPSRRTAPRSPRTSPRSGPGTQIGSGGLAGEAPPGALHDGASGELPPFVSRFESRDTQASGASVEVPLVGGAAQVPGPIESTGSGEGHGESRGGRAGWGIEAGYCLGQNQGQGYGCGCGYGSGNTPRGGRAYHAAGSQRGGAGLDSSVTSAYARLAVHPSQLLDASYLRTLTYTGVPQYTRFRTLSPSLAVGFYARDRRDFVDLCRRLARAGIATVRCTRRSSAQSVPMTHGAAPTNGCSSRMNDALRAASGESEEAERAPRVGGERAPLFEIVGNTPAHFHWEHIPRGERPDTAAEAFGLPIVGAFHGGATAQVSMQARPAASDGRVSRGQGEGEGGEFASIGPASLGSVAVGSTTDRAGSHALGQGGSRSTGTGTGAGAGAGGMPIHSSQAPPRLPRVATGRKGRRGSADDAAASSSPGASAIARGRRRAPGLGGLMDKQQQRGSGSGNGSQTVPSAGLQALAEQVRRRVQVQACMGAVHSSDASQDRSSAASGASPAVLRSQWQRLDEGSDQSDGMLARSPDGADATHGTTQGMDDSMPMDGGPLQRLRSMGGSQRRVTAGDEVVLGMGGLGGRARATLRSSGKIRDASTVDPPDGWELL